MDTLKHLIDEKTKRLETLKDPGFAPLLKGWSSFWLILSSFLLVCGIGGCVSDGGPDGWDGWTLIFWVGVMMMAFTVATATQVKSTSEKDTPDQRVHRSFQLTDDIAGRAELPEVRQLEQEIAALRKNLRKGEELTKIESELATLNPDRFGCQTTEELCKLRDSRQKLIQRIMGIENSPITSSNRTGQLPANITDKAIGFIPNRTPPEGITVEDDDDPMKAWLIEVAKLEPEPDSAHKLATEHPNSYADLLVRHHGAVICTFSNCTLQIASKELKSLVPRQLLETLLKAGVTAGTPITWYNEFETDELDPETFESIKAEGKRLNAAEAIAGLPA